MFAIASNPCMQRLQTCISLSMGFFMFRGFGAYGGNVLPIVLAAAAMAAICSSDSSDSADIELNVGGVNVEP